MTFSKLFFYFCIFFLLGVLIRSTFNFSSNTWYLLIFFVFIFTLIIFVVFYKRKTAILGLCLLVFIFGVFWEEKFEREIIPTKNDIHFFNDKGEIVFEGIVSKEPKKKTNNTQLVIESKKIISEKIEDSVNGKVLVILPLGFDFQYGDKVLVRGKLCSPKNFTSGFNWREFLRKDRVYSIVYNPEIKLISSGNGNLFLSKIFFLKRKFIKTAKILPPPEGAILEGITLGEESRFSRSLKESFSLSGLSHINAVSGMNITIIFGIFFSVLLSLGLWRREATILTILILVLYILIVGAPASAVRAGIMGGLLYLGYALGRLIRTSRLIVFTATLMVIQNPLILTRDVGFQLSFLAFLGLILLSPIFEKLLNAEDSLIKKLISQTLAAQTLCFPILIFNFGKFSIISPLSNILVLPLIPYLTVAGFLFLILGTIFPSLTLPLSFILWPPFTFVVKVAEITSSLPFSFVSLNFHRSIIFFFYIPLLYFLFRVRKKNRFLYGKEKIK